MNLLAPKVYSF